MAARFKTIVFIVRKFGLSIFVVMILFCLQFKAEQLLPGIIDEQVRVFSELLRTIPNISNFPQQVKVSGGSVLALSAVNYADGGIRKKCSAVAVEHMGKPVILTALHCVGQNIGRYEIQIRTSDPGFGMEVKIEKIIAFPELSSLKTQNKFLAYPFLDIAVLADLKWKSSNKSVVLSEIPIVELSNEIPKLNQDVYSFGRPYHEAGNIILNAPPFILIAAQNNFNAWRATKSQVDSGTVSLNWHRSLFDINDDQYAVFAPLFSDFSFFTRSPVLPGMSGGPVFNDAGKVVGINNSTIALPEGSDGLPFTISTHSVNLKAIQFLLNQIQ